VSILSVAVFGDRQQRPRGERERTRGTLSWIGATVEASAVLARARTFAAVADLKM